MDLTPILGIATIGAALFGIIMWTRANGASGQLQAAKEKAEDAERQLGGARTELSDAKQELTKSKKQLTSAREETKKKARREGKKQKAQAANERQQQEADAPDIAEAKAEHKRLKQVIAGLEKQVENTLAASKRTVADAEKIARENVDGQVGKYKSRAQELEKTLNELRASVKKQRESRPDVPGSQLDLKALPAEVVQELARYYKKGNEYERLYAVAQGQVQLERDKFTDVNRRYLAVCRELAVAASADGVDDKRAKELAEAVVSQSDAAPRGPRGRRPAQAANAEGGEGGEKKKRRRRRRKKGGEGEQLSLDTGASDGDRSGDAPKGDGQKADAPKSNAPKADGQKADAPKDDAQKADAPKADTPKSDAPKADAPPTPAAIEASKPEKTEEPRGANAE